MITFKSFLYLIIITTLLSFQSANNCDPKKLKDEVKNELGEYNYDISKLTRFTYKNKPHVKEAEIELYYGEKYRLIFNTSEVPVPIVISLYNKDKDHKNRKLLYTSKNESPDKKVFVFEYTHARRIFIDYEIPADTTKSGNILSGCVMFVMGYK